MNLITSTSKNTINLQSLLNWLSESIESLDQFGEYEQLQLIICASEIGLNHPKIDQKVSEIAHRDESQSLDYVVEFLEQLIMMKYHVGDKRRRRFYDFWIEQKHYETQSLVTTAYLFGYLAMKENELSGPEMKKQAIEWLKEITFLPSMSFTAWMVYYFDQHEETEEATKRFEELMSLRLENGSWNNFPLQTIQIAYPLSLTSFANHESLVKTNEFILAQSWEGFSGEINFETGLIKWLNSKGLVRF